MGSVIHVNSSHLTYLKPLLKWRVLDLNSLREECLERPHIQTFYRIIRYLEKLKVLETYRDPFNRKKYVYLGKIGEAELQIKENPTSISEDTLLHDIKVSELSRAFLDKGFINEAELEHQIHDKRNFVVNYKIIPDALFHGERNGKSYKMAFELELTRKNNQRLIEKGRQYLESTFYDYALYFFSKKNLMDQYINLFHERFGEKMSERLMFFYHPKLTGSCFDLAEAEGFFRGKKLRIEELFRE